MTGLAGFFGTGGNGDGDPYNAGNQSQHFVLRIIRTAGTLEHFMYHPMSTSREVCLASAVNGPSLTPVAIPTGADASTAMASGVKISSANPERIYFDTADIQPAEAIRKSSVTARVWQSNQSTLGNVVAAYLTADINGDSRRRLAVSAIDTGGAVFNIATVLNLNNEFIDIEVKGWMPPYS